VEQSKILIADDDPIIREILFAALKGASYGVETAHDGLETLARIRQGGIALVLLDIWMPGKTGIEILSELHGLPTPPRVIVLTSDTTSNTMLQAIRENAYMVLTKPIDTKSLLVAVERSLSSSPDEPPIEVLSATPNWVELLAPCDLSTADRIINFMSRLDADLDDDTRDVIGVAFNELLRNAIEWGGELDPNRKVRIAYLRTKRLILYRISDPGAGFDPNKIDHAAFNTPDSPQDHIAVREEKGMRPGGFGILMVKGLVDELLYNESHNEVVFIKYLDEQSSES
jgi:CheY-like chemotaxis protein/anti-sigma regulatory factor (Ser/Thr protein kinase)